ncbi:MAG: amidase family protein [Dehalococcoidia bacterium]
MATPAVSIDPFTSASDLIRALRAKQVSPPELLEMYLARIERYNSTLNAIVIPNTEQARGRARQVEPGPSGGALEGLPLTIKDCIVVGGLRATAGVEELRDNIPEKDGPVAARVLGAGAVLIGKTNVPPNAGDWQADNPIFGRTVNPWDHARTPGGSTGGGSAALAAGLTALEFGSDIGGSIRVPAAFCGLYGHRPSDSAVPRSGHVPGPPVPRPGGIMGVQGPLARSAEDLELAMDVIVGPEPGEDQWKLELPPARAESLSGLRVAMLPPLDWLPVDDSVLAAMDQVATAASRAGARVESVQPELDWKALLNTYRALLAVYIFAALPPEEKASMAALMEANGDEMERGTIRGLRATATDYLGFEVEREHFRRAYARFFHEWDVLVAPITIGPAFEHTTLPWTQRTVPVNGKPVPYGMQIVPPALATLPGLPATAFPVLRTEVGGKQLPIGLQAIGPYLEDRTPIRFAALMEREIGGFVAPAGYEQ